MLRDLEKQQGRMDDVLAKNQELRPAEGAEGEESSKEDELADELAQLREDTAEKIKRLQVLIFRSDLQKSTVKLVLDGHCIGRPLAFYGQFSMYFYSILIYIQSVMWNAVAGHDSGSSVQSMTINNRR